MKILIHRTVFLLTLLTFAIAQAGEITKNPTILYVSDSHSYGKLGTVIEKNLSKISEHVIMESSCGSTANTWLGKSGFEKTVCGFWKKDGADEVRSVNHQMPKFSSEIEKYQPRVVIVQLGTNMAASSKPINSKASIAEMMNEINMENALCIWIGPPDANSKIVTKDKLAVVNKLIFELAAKNNCHFIDSLKLTKFPADSSEGIHYPPKLSAQWGEKLSLLIIDYLQKTINY